MKLLHFFWEVFSCVLSIFHWVAWFSLLREGFDDRGGKRSSIQEAKKPPPANFWPISPVIHCEGLRKQCSLNPACIKDYLGWPTPVGPWGPPWPSSALRILLVLGIESGFQHVNPVLSLQFRDVWIKKYACKSPCSLNINMQKYSYCYIA